MNIYTSYFVIISLFFRFLPTVFLFNCLISSIWLHLSPFSLQRSLSVSVTFPKFDLIKTLPLSLFLLSIENFESFFETHIRETVSGEWFLYISKYSDNTLYNIRWYSEHLAHALRYHDLMGDPEMTTLLIILRTGRRHSWFSLSRKIHIFFSL